MSFFTELKRRNVFKVGIAYAIVAWLLIQVVAIVLPTFDAPRWVQQTITFIIIIGFPLALFLAWAYELTPDGIKPTPSIAPAESITRETGKRLNYTIIGLMALVIVFLVVDNYVLTNKSGEEKGVKSEERTVQVQAGPATTPTADAQQKPTIPRNSIAVLPFVNMSSDKSQDYFADGIAEEILNSLAGIKDLEVRGRTSSFYFKGKHEELRTISDMLHVEYVLEGSVRKDADQVRITVQLINAQKDEHLWSKTYDRTLKDIFAIQEDIARSIADTLQITLGVGELGRAPGMTRNVAAYDQYLNGLAYNRRPSRNNLTRAINYFKRAIELDPGFALPWTGLAATYLTAQVYIPEQAGKWQKQGEDAARHAIKLAPELSGAHAALANWLREKNEWQAAESEHLKASALSPSHYNYGLFLLITGRPQQSIEYFRQNRRANPLVEGPVMMLAINLDILGNHAEAITEYKQTSGLIGGQGPKDLYYLWSVLQEDGLAAAKDLLKTEVVTANQTIPMPLHAAIAAHIESPQLALAEIHRTYEKQNFNDPARLAVMALWAGWFGDPDLANKILHDAVLKNNLNLFGAWLPFMQAARRKPEFKALLTEIGLVDYWRSTGTWGEFCHPVGKDDFECK